jgi:AP2 domain
MSHLRKYDYPSIEFLYECFDYRNGKLFWRKRPRSHFSRRNNFVMFNNEFPGKEAGHIAIDNGLPRVVIGITFNNKLSVICRSKIVWAMHYGWPPEDKVIDHQFGNTLDDRIKVLRLADRFQSAANMKLRNTNKSGFKGVHWHRASGKWRAEVSVNGKKVYRKLFSTIEEARDAYIENAKKLHGGFYRESVSSKMSKKRQV